MKSYLNYLTEVLGIQAVMMPKPLKPFRMVGQDPSAESGAEASPTIAAPAFFYATDGAFDAHRDFRQIDLVIVNWIQNASESLFEKSVAELFGKMLAAMKIPDRRILVLDCVMNDRNLIPNELFKICEPRLVLFFSSDPQHLSEMQLRGSSNWLETLSPAYLLGEPLSKKLVWNDMQKIMNEMKKEN